MVLYTFVDSDDDKDSVFPCGEWKRNILMR